jgi:hypothetical protein
MNLDLAVLTDFFTDLARPYPTRDWIIVAVCGLILFVSGAGVAAQLFWGTQTGSIVSASADVPRAPIPVSRDAIQFVIETYQVRATNYQNKAFPAVTLSDPRPKSVGTK